MFDFLKRLFQNQPEPASEPQVTVPADQPDLAPTKRPVFTEHIRGPQSFITGDILAFRYHDRERVGEFAQYDRLRRTALVYDYSLGGLPRWFTLTKMTSVVQLIPTRYTYEPDQN